MILYNILFALLYFRDESKQEQLWTKTMEYLKGHLTEEEILCLEGDKQAVT